jgi:hypothetical protein
MDAREILAAGGTALASADDAGPFSRPQRWDGKSTYDPATGCIDLGLFYDGGAAHWRLHAPRAGSCGGAWGGVITGEAGSGKTAAAHVIAAEAALAVTCAACGAARQSDGACARCDMRRICAVIMCDPLMAPFAAWRGHADLTAWGVAACVHALRMLRAAADGRAADQGCRARGWFDPAPGRPLLQAVIDDWPAVEASPYGAEAAGHAEAIRRTGRKTGVSVVRLDGSGRAGRGQDEGFNIVRLRDLATRALPAGVPGLGYTTGYDNRRHAACRVKHLSETASDGITVRTLAGQIAITPITFDPPAERAFGRHGFTARRQVIDAAAVTAWQCRDQN